ncbi:MAG: hypothetical protein ACKOC5_01110 [Chloroflexota bacterium]
MTASRRQALRWIGAGLVGLALTGGLFSSAWGLQSTPRTLFILQRGTPVLVANFIQPSAGCNWSGVGGQVFDRAGQPLNGRVVRVTGRINGQEVNRYAVTGSSQQLGAGGFDLSLADRPSASSELWLQLADVSGAALSGKYAFSVSSSCSANLTLVNLVELVLTNPLYLPVVRR